MSTYAVAYVAGCVMQHCESFASQRSRNDSPDIGVTTDAGLREVAQRIEPAERSKDTSSLQVSAMNAQQISRMHAAIDAAYAQRQYVAGYLDARDGEPATPPTGATRSMYAADYEKGYGDGQLSRTMAPIVAVQVVANA